MMLVRQFRPRRPSTPVLISPGYTLVETDRTEAPLTSGGSVVSRTPTGRCAYTKLQESCFSFADVTIGSHAFPSASRRWLETVIPSTSVPTSTVAPAASPTTDTGSGGTGDNSPPTGSVPDVISCYRTRNQALCTDGSDSVSYAGARISYAAVPSSEQDQDSIATLPVSKEDVEDLVMCGGICTDKESGALVFPDDDSDKCEAVSGWLLVNENFREPCKFVRNPCEIIEITKACEDTVAGSYNPQGKYYLAVTAPLECDADSGVDVYRPVWFQDGNSEDNFSLFFRGSRWYLHYDGCKYPESFARTNFAYFGTEDDLQPHIRTSTDEDSNMITCYDGREYDNANYEFNTYYEETELEIKCIKEGTGSTNNGESAAFSPSPSFCIRVISASFLAILSMFVMV